MLHTTMTQLLREEWRSKFGCAPPDDATLWHESWVEQYMAMMSPQEPTGFPPVPCLPGEGPTPVKPPLDAPALWCGWQEIPGRTPLALWTLTAAIPGHPCHSTVVSQTLREAGYHVAEPPQEDHHHAH